MNKITAEMERIGQYSTLQGARIEARRATVETGVKHGAIITQCYRVNEDDTVSTFSCYTVVRV